jgi:hypothetical protein
MTMTLQPSADEIDEHTLSFLSQANKTPERTSDLHTIRTNVSLFETPEEGVLTAKPGDLSDLMKEVVIGRLITAKATSPC